MGSATSVMDMALATVVFKPPLSSYSAKDHKSVCTINSDEICMQLCALFSVIDRSQSSTIDTYQAGVAEDMGQTRCLTQFFADQLDVNVLSYNYVGYGLSSAGTTSESNMNNAIEVTNQYPARSRERHCSSG